jgi:hypothetical protein
VTPRSPRLGRAGWVDHPPVCAPPPGSQGQGRAAGGPHPRGVLPWPSVDRPGRSPCSMAGVAYGGVAPPRQSDHRHGHSRATARGIGRTAPAAATTGCRVRAPHAPGRDRWPCQLRGLAIFRTGRGRRAAHRVAGVPGPPQALYAGAHPPRSRRTWPRPTTGEPGGRSHPCGPPTPPPGAAAPVASRGAPQHASDSTGRVSGPLGCARGPPTAQRLCPGWGGPGG